VDAQELCGTLEELDVENNELEALPQGVRELSRLRSLTLSRNYIATFPKQIAACSSLVHLRLSGNALIAIEPRVPAPHPPRPRAPRPNTRRPGTPVLACAGPRAWGGGPCGASRARLHGQVGLLTCLQTLEVDLDKITQPPMEVCVQGCAAMVRYLAQVHAALKTLHLHVPSLGLVSFPPELVHSVAHPCPQAAKLQTVSLTCNKLETIPQCMAALTSMQRLDLSQNLIARVSPRPKSCTLSDALGGIRHPRRIERAHASTPRADAGAGGRAQVSVTLGALHALRYLDLSGNLIEDLPTTLGQLRNLNVLKLGANRLSSLPPFTAQLEQLKELCVEGNQLQALFPGIDRCRRLAKLVLSDNKMPCVPYELARITALREIVMEGNPLVSPPPEIRQRGTPTVLQYLGRFEEAERRRAPGLHALRARCSSCASA
jgi:Leucine-rich repeat (LRR) protein